VPHGGDGRDTAEQNEDLVLVIPLLSVVNKLTTINAAKLHVADRFVVDKSIGWHLHDIKLLFTACGYCVDYDKRQPRDGRIEITSSQFYACLNEILYTPALCNHYRGNCDCAATT
jgi:hypothetical protein